MPDIINYLNQIRTAVYGRDVRDAIANGIAQCYQDTSNGVTLAETKIGELDEAIEQIDDLVGQANEAVGTANGVVARADELNTALSNNAKDLVLVQNAQPDKEFNKVWVDPDVDEYEVPTYEEFSDLKSVVDGAEIRHDSFVSFAWEAGSFIGNGDERPTAGSIRTIGRTPVPDENVKYTFVLGNYTGTIGYIIMWDAEGNLYGEMSTFTKGTDKPLTLPAGGSFRISIRPSSSSSDVLDPADGNTLYKMSYEVVESLKTIQETISGISESMDEIEEFVSTAEGLVGIEEPIPANWQTGDVSNTGTNSNSSSTKIIRTATPWIAPSFSRVYYEVPEGYYLRVFIRDSSGTKKSDASHLTGKGSFELSEGDRFRLTMTLVNGDDIDLQTASSLLDIHGVTPLRDEIEAVADVVDRNTLLSYMNFSIFEKFGVIGDSFASGSLHHPDDGGWTGNYQMSWPQILARKTGSTAVNFTAGGRSTKTWLADNTNGLAALLSAPAQQLYIIALGINDNTQINAGTLTLGTIDDVNVSDYTQNPDDTFFGCYGRIIGNIKAHAPYAKIVCLSVARVQERNMDQYIQQIAEKYGLPFIDLKTDPYFVSTIFYGSMVDSHPLAYGYAGMANAIERLILLDILSNTSYWGTYYGLVAADTSGQPDE